MSGSTDEGRLQAFWRARSMRAQLLIVFILVEAIAAVAGGALIIYRAGASARAEMAASMQLAEVLADEAAQLVSHGVPEQQVLQTLPAQLRFVRHVRVTIKDAAGKPVGTEIDKATDTKADDRDRAPGWFASLIRPPVERREKPVVVAGQTIGSVVIVSEPADEIAEVWENTVALGAVAIAMTLALLGLLYVAVGRVLRPLTTLSAGLSDLERRQYQVRMESPRVHEFAAITDQFNALAATLDTTRRENTDLSRRIVTAQDDERRNTALELHDEVGPSLFGLKANANSLIKAVDALPANVAGAIKDRARDLLAIVERLQTTNRSILQRLRPMALGNVPLRDVLSELVHERAREYPAVSFHFSADRIAAGYGDSIDLTLYRCVQEGITNAIRHGNPRNVEIRLSENALETDATIGSSHISLAIRDDGTGMPAQQPRGFGLQGMLERVRALGGDLAIESAAGRGTLLRISIPLRDNAPLVPADRMAEAK
ncbi:MAG: ATP-binding protein [Xanthobacteraceae bacterium]